MVKDKKKIIFFLLNFIYMLIGICFLLYFDLKFSITKSSYEVPLFVIIVLVYVIITELTNSLISKFLSFIYVSVFGLYLLAQNIYQSVFSQYFRLSYVYSLRNEVNSFRTSVYEYISLQDFIPFIIFGIITIIFVVIYFVYQRKIIIDRKFLLLRLCVFLLLIPCFLEYCSFNKMIDDAKHQEDLFQLNKTDYYLYDTMFSSNDFVDKFGLITFCYRDIEVLFEFDDYNQYKDEVDQFLKDKPEHVDNDLTGIFEGKDVIFIQAESYNRYALDEELTPTIYKIATKGIWVDGFDTPSLVGSTSDTEFIANTSLIPDSAESITCYRYIDNKYDTTLASVFKRKGYFTEAFHNNYGIYYNRYLLFPTQFEYDSFRDCTRMGFENMMDDYGFASDLYWMYDNASKPFMAYWITFSGHQPYDLDSVGVKEEYVSLVKQKYPNLEDSQVSYLAKNMDLDRTIESILSTAEYFERQNNLVIVLFGDHRAKIVGLGDDEAYKTDLYIYCPGNEIALKYEKPSTCLDLIPTIANLFNLEYDYHSILGRDIFDETYGGLCFTPHDNFYTNTYHFHLLEDVLDNNENVVTDPSIIAEANRYADYKRISKIILKTNYFEIDNK